ncbi:hypothetical protein Trydic_g6741 [Trypoxylus dichotomus]
MNSHTSRPRVRLRKVVSKKASSPSKIVSDTQTICEVKVEDYQITRDGRVIDGTSAKTYKHRENRMAHKSSYINSHNTNHSHNHCQELKPYINDNDQKAMVNEGSFASRSGSDSLSMKDSDTYDYFGKYVASLLRTMEVPEAIVLQGDIVNMIVDAHTKKPEDEDSYYR